jgi:hypothetical protein
MRILLILLLMTGTVYASHPDHADDVRATALMYSAENHQPSYKSQNSKYEQIKEIMPKGSKMLIKTDEYVGPLGAGYIITVKRVIDGKEWIKQKHIGPESRQVNTEWTQVQNRGDL